MSTARRGLKHRRQRTGEGIKAFDVSSFMKVSEADMAAEVESYRRTRARLEASAKRLVQDTEAIQEKEEKWNSELDNLIESSEKKLLELEETQKKQEFSWQREQKSLLAQLERLMTRLDDSEADLDERLERSERRRENELNELKEELSRLQKSTTEHAAELVVLQAEAEEFTSKHRKVEQKLKTVKAQTGDVAKELERTQKDARKQGDALEALQKEEKELSKEVDVQEGLEAELVQANKMFKKLTKEQLSLKEQSSERHGLQEQLEVWEKKNSEIEREIEKLKNNIQFAKKGIAGDGEDQDKRRGRRDGQTDDDDDDDSSEAAKLIEELQQELRALERAHEERRLMLEEETNEINTEQEKVKTQISRSEDSLKELNIELANARKFAREDEKEKNDKLESHQKEYEEGLKSLEKLYKDLSKQGKEYHDLKNKLNDGSLELKNTENEVLRSNASLENLRQDLDRVTRVQRNTNSEMERTKVKLTETDQQLRETREKLANLQQCYRDWVKQHEALVSELEEELYNETSVTDDLRKEGASLHNEVLRLRWYFRPSEGLKDDKSDEVDPIALEKYMDNLVATRKKELENIRSALQSVKPKHRSLRDLEAAFQKGLASLDEMAREDLGFELSDLNAVMDKLRMPTRDRFQMFVCFVENNIDPGIVREIGVSLEQMLSPEGLHPLRTPQHMITLALKDAKLNPEIKVRDALLDRLANERYTRTKKDLEYCKIVILEGEEWPDEEYNAQYGRQ